MVTLEIIMYLACNKLICYILQKPLKDCFISSLWFSNSCNLQASVVPTLTCMQQDIFETSFPFSAETNLSSALYLYTKQAKAAVCGSLCLISAFSSSE